MNFIERNHELIIFSLLLIVVVLVFFMSRNFVQAEVYVCFYGSKEPWITQNTMIEGMYRENNVYKDDFLGFEMYCTNLSYNGVKYVGTYTFEKNALPIIRH